MSSEGRERFCNRNRNEARQLGVRKSKSMPELPIEEGIARFRTLASSGSPRYQTKRSSISGLCTSEWSQHGCRARATTRWFGTLTPTMRLAAQSHEGCPRGLHP
jgi:hypothetical protein